MARFACCVLDLNARRREHYKVVEKLSRVDDADVLVIYATATTAAAFAAASALSALSVHGACAPPPCISEAWRRVGETFSGATSSTACTAVATDSTAVQMIDKKCGVQSE